MSRIKVNAVTNLAGGRPDIAAPIQSPKVIVNFQAFADGSVTIFNSFNVNSVTFQGTPGVYTITFTNPLSSNGVSLALGTVGLVTGNPAFVYLISGNNGQVILGTRVIQSNGLLAAETSQFYQCVVFDPS
jgi:hypothetical protein